MKDKIEKKGFVTYEYFMNTLKSLSLNLSKRLIDHIQFMNYLITEQTSLFFFTDVLDFIINDKKSIDNQKVTFSLG